ncbi:hypothetical protein H9W90_11935 [Polaribacter pectinis]|uniref:Uncharacterized protein n=1 Tax=Polaribacter pectinis TaxID=2738844 RepID=A0A7G9L8E7_9FLAO|nr:hypothetical protein [Polaribacter pectinis]QNM84896.1 hypothetical protein H9W90_11935 [Polaribacter pectinis]
MKAKVNFSYLQKLNTILDCPCGCRMTIKDELFSIETYLLPSHLKMHYDYIVGKFFFYQSKVSNKLFNLEQANEKFNSIFIIANSSKTEVANPKYYFKTAHTKYELSKMISNIEDAKDLHKQALKINLEGLKKYKGNPSLLWLLSELKK